MDNIIVKITAESDMSDATKDFDSLKQKEAEILQGMEALKKKQAEFQGAPKVISLLDAEYKKLEKDLKTTQTSMAGFAKSQKGVNDAVIAGATSAPRLRTELMNVKEELARMEQAGDNSSKAFINLSIRAGQLQDQMGDTRQRIQILSSDTRALDTAMGLGRGLAGGFSAATSAAALLGGESEELTKAFLKVQAATAILSGVQEVANMLNKDSVVMVNLQTAAESSNTLSKIKNYTATKIQAANTVLETAANNGSKVAKVGATVTQWALNAAVTAFPIVALIAGLSAIVLGFAAFSSGAAEAERAQARLNAEAENFSADMKERNRLTDQHIAVMKAEGKGMEEIYAYQLKRAEQDRKYYDQQWAYLSNSGKASKEQLEEARKNAEDAGNKVLEIKSQHIVDETQLQTDANKKKLDDQKAANDKAEEKAREHAAYMLDINKQLEDSKIELMKDGVDKQVALIELEYKRKMSAIKGNSAKEIQLRESLEREKLQKIDKITQMQALKTEKLTGDGVIKIYDNINAGKEEKAKKHSEKLNSIVNAGIESQKEEFKTEVEGYKDKEAKKIEITQMSLDAIGEIGNLLFDGKSQQLNQELSDLENYYTTDIEEAKKNKNLKLISEEEFAKRQTEIKIKQAKLDKEQALFNIALSTAQAVIAALAMVPPNIPLSIFAGVTGAAQAIAVASKPLPKYAKGKKAGGSGHFATVGELGAETMWIPDNAAVIPHNRKLNFDTFQDFGIPTEMDSKWIRGNEIDYDKLGASVGKHVKIPKQKAVTVNVDKNGITVNESDLSRTTFLNKKYQGSW